MKTTVGTVLIRFTKPGASRPTTRRVSIAPAFDPDATSMVPIPGWTAADPGGRLIPGWALYRTDADGRPLAA